MLKSWPLNSQDGHVALVAAVVILTLLTIIGFSASRVATNEVTMARNESVHQRQFLPGGRSGHGSRRQPGQPWQPERRCARLDGNGGRQIGCQQPAKLLERRKSRQTATSEVDDQNHAAFVAGVEGVAPGESLGMDRPTVFILGVYGSCEWNGESIVKIGYRAVY